MIAASGPAAQDVAAEIGTERVVVVSDRGARQLLFELFPAIADAFALTNVDRVPDHAHGRERPELEHRAQVVLLGRCRVLERVGYGVRGLGSSSDAPRARRQGDDRQERVA